MKYKFAILMALILITLPFFGCNTINTSEPEYSVAILMHCASSDKKHIDADIMKKIFDDIGYEATIYYANKDSALQNSQINDLIDESVDAIIITPILSDNLSASLESAANEGIVIIAYDKLILNTDAVNYFAAYDHNLIGIQQGVSLIEGMRANGEGPYNIELFAGTSNEEKVYSYFSSAMSVLQPLIDSGEIVVVSGQISYSEIQDKAYEICDANTRLQNILASYYNDEIQLHGILSPSDKMSLEFIDVLIDNDDKYTTFPIITGQNAELKSIQAIINSQQHSTVFKDSNTLAQVTASMVIAVLNGDTPEINDSTTFDNGKKIVPAYLCEPILVTKENYKNVLLDTEYFEYIEVFPDQ